MTLARRCGVAGALGAMTALLLGVSCGKKEAPRKEPASRQGTQPREARPATGATAPADPNAWVVGKPYLCRRARGKITVDDKDHPGEWTHAMVIRDFKVPITREPAQSPTVARMLWDDECLYLLAVAHDADLRGTLKGKTARLWQEDVVEIFLKPPALAPTTVVGTEPPGEGGGYYEFEVSPANALLDLQISLDRFTSFERRAEWESGAPSAVFVKGTVNNPDDADEYYRVVLAIPWKSMPFAGAKPPKAGDVWRFIIARCDLSRQYDDTQELSTCVPLPKPDFHMIDEYPQVRFAE